MTWQTTNPPRQGEYLVVDKAYGMRSVAVYAPYRGWYINGYWRDHDAVRCWQELDDVPARERTS